MIKEFLCGRAKVAILSCSLDEANPKELMDNAVLEYVGNQVYNEFVEEHGDIPHTRIIIFNLSELFSD